MARPVNPERRREVVDAVIGQLAHTGLTGFSLRTLAAGLGRSTRVLTHHFKDREALLGAVLSRLDERQHAALRATSGWDDPAVPVSAIVQAAWKRNLSAEELAMTRLVREVEGLAAAGRVTLPEGQFVRGRAEFVAGCLQVRGMDEQSARVAATMLNSAYSGLQADYLVTGDTERVTAALAELCAWLDALTGLASSQPSQPSQSSQSS